MNIVKKISFKRTKELREYQELISKFDNIKLNKKGKGIDKIKDIADLNFFFLIQYANIIDEIDYSKIFLDKNKIDFNVLLKEQQKILGHIKNSNNNYPEFLKKLGYGIDIKGCYLIATTKKNLLAINSKNTMNSICIKFSGELPSEFSQLCDEYSKNYSTELKDVEDFENFIKLTFEEEDFFLQNIIESINKDYNKNTIKGNNDSILFSTNQKDVKNTIGKHAINNIEKIYDLKFLKSMLNNAIENEQYEYCTKIKDRIDYLNLNS